MLSASLRSSALNDHISKQATAETDWCGVVGPRGLCRPRDEKKGFPTNTSSPLRDLLRRLWRSLKGSRKGRIRKFGPTGSGHFFGTIGSLAPWNLPAWGPQTPLAGLGFKVQQLWIEQYCRKVVFTVLI